MEAVHGLMAPLVVVACHPPAEMKWVRPEAWVANSTEPGLPLLDLRPESWEVGRNPTLGDRPPDLGLVSLEGRRNRPVGAHTLDRLPESPAVSPLLEDLVSFRPTCDCLAKG